MLNYADVFFSFFFGSIISLGNWQQAIDDYTRAAEIKKEILEDDNREIAEAYYKLALALEFSKQFISARDNARFVVTVLNKKLANLKEKTAAGPAQGEEDMHATLLREIEDIEGLLPDMQSKVFWCINLINDHGMN